MKKKILVLLVAVFSIFALTGCNSSKGSDELITIINQLEEYSESDFSFDESNYKNAAIYGKGKSIIIDEEQEEIMAMYTDDSELVILEISYVKNGTNIEIYDIYITYVNIEEKLFMDINYDRYDDSWDPDGYNAGNFNEFIELLQDMSTETFNALYIELK